jgi:hypothetical protein
MRMWMVNPKILCRKHLLGEHVEEHMFVGTLIKGVSVKGYLENNLFEPSSLYSRHETLVKEMKSRGMNHKSELKKIPIDPKILSIKVDSEKSLEDLLSRCDECRSRYNNLKRNN